MSEKVSGWNGAVEIVDIRSLYSFKSACESYSSGHWPWFPPHSLSCLRLHT